MLSKYCSECMSRYDCLAVHEKTKKFFCNIDDEDFEDVVAELYADLMDNSEE